MKKLIFVVLVAPMIALAGENQQQCVARVKKAMTACGEVCDQINDKKEDVDFCYKECGREAREKFVDECKVPLKK